MISHGSHSWPFPATINGTISFGPGIATWFGGDDDPQDSGSTASGVPTRGNPSLMACSVPMTDAREPATQGSPIPHLDWGTLVQVTNLDTGLVLVVPLVDNGPGIGADKEPGKPHIVDLTKAAFVALGGDLKAGRMRVSCVILDRPPLPLSTLYPPSVRNGVTHDH